MLEPNVVFATCRTRLGPLDLVVFLTDLLGIADTDFA